MMKPIRLLLVAGILARPLAAQAEEEPTREACDAAVAKAHKLAETLPRLHASHYFAEVNLRQALVEAGNGEFDDCLELAEQAEDEVRNLRHLLKPGESLRIMGPGGPDDMIEVARSG
ncbi:MAG: hypothetical protein ACJ8AW_11155 [Rhodopila sp.]